MEKYIFTISLIFLSAQLAFANCADSTAIAERQDTSIVEREYLDVIEHSDTIVWMLLDPMSDVRTHPAIELCGHEKDDEYITPPNYNIWPDYLGQVLHYAQDTLSERKAACVETLAYAGSFVKSDMVKESTFLPDIAIWFHANNKDVIFSYSLYCDLCRFNDYDSYQELDGEIIRKAILEMACEVFPLDRYMRNIKRRER